MFELSTLKIWWKCVLWLQSFENTKNCTSPVTQLTSFLTFSSLQHYHKVFRNTLESVFNVIYQLKMVVSDYDTTCMWYSFTNFFVIIAQCLIFTRSITVLLYETITIVTRNNIEQSPHSCTQQWGIYTRCTIT